MIELLVGMIASGKSTYCLQRAREGALITNDDNIVNLVHGDAYKLYNTSLKPLYKILELNIIHYAVANKLDVVIDRTNLKRSTRLKYIQIAKSLDSDIIAVCFKVETPFVHAMRRMKDPRGLSFDDWMKAATFHYEKYEAPSLEEGFKEIIYVSN